MYILDSLADTRRWQDDLSSMPDEVDFSSLSPADVYLSRKLPLSSKLPACYHKPFSHHHIISEIYSALITLYKTMGALHSSWLKVS